MGMGGRDEGEGRRIRKRRRGRGRGGDRTATLYCSLLGIEERWTVAGQETGLEMSGPDCKFTPSE